jgi:hypothetical protein
MFFNPLLDDKNKKSYHLKEECFYVIILIECKKSGTLTQAQ